DVPKIVRPHSGDQQDAPRRAHPELEVRTGSNHVQRRNHGRHIAPRQRGVVVARIALVLVGGRSMVAPAQELTVEVEAEGCAQFGDELDVPFVASVQFGARNLLLERTYLLTCREVAASDAQGLTSAVAQFVVELQLQSVK